MVNTKNLKQSFMAERFAMWDLHLYLDTHPCDEDALKLLECYKAQYEKTLEEYKRHYGPLTHNCASGEKWVCTPFPWVNSGSDC